MRHDRKGSDNSVKGNFKKQVKVLLRKRAILIALLRLIEFFLSDGSEPPSE